MVRLDFCWGPASPDPLWIAALLRVCWNAAAPYELALNPLRLEHNPNAV